MFGKILLFLLLIASGFGLLIYTEKVKSFIGEVAFAEKYLGSGGTYTFLKLLGLFLLFASIIYITGTYDRFIPEFIKGTASGK